MDVSFSGFLSQLGSNPSLLIIVIITLGVIIVNGWTDAPNAIATCVTTRCMKANSAIFMAAICNFAGIIVMTLLFKPEVSYTVRDMVNFSGENGNKDALIALCAAMVAIVTWATAAWKFGIPTSESHALIAGLSGAAIALQGGIGGINGEQWIKVIYGLVFTTLFSFVLGYISAKLLQFICKNKDRRPTNRFFQKAQIASAALAAFAHGAQDGQKFMAVFLIGMALSQNQDTTEFTAPIWLMILCAVVMGIGTSMGGKKIIKSVGKDMAELKPYQGFASDFVASTGLLL